MTTKSHDPSLFQQGDPHNLPPLADRVRPTTLEGFVGHEELLGPGRLLQKALETDTLFSMVLWGPPGSGKTTLAKLLARHSQAAFHEFSAVAAGVKDIRAILDGILHEQCEQKRLPPQTQTPDSFETCEEIIIRDEIVP